MPLHHLSNLPPLLGWCLLAGVAALAGHLVHRFTGFPRMLGYTVVGLLAGWASVGDVAWPLAGGPLLLLQLAVGTSMLMAGAQLPLRWLARQPWLLLQSVAESSLALVATTAALLALGQGWAVALAVGAVAMAASPAVLLRITADLRASGAVTDRSLLLATLASLYAMLVVLALSAAVLPSTADGAGNAADSTIASLQLSAAGMGQLLLHAGMTALLAVVLAAALWPVLRWQSSRSDTTALYLLAVLVAVCLLAAQWGGSALLAMLLAGALLRNLSPMPLIWPPAFLSANAMLNVLMFVLVASMAAQVANLGTLAVVVAAVVVARMVAKMGGVLLLGLGTGIGWRRQWPVACAQTPLSGLALLLVSGLALQWQGALPLVAATVAAIALPMVVVSEVLGVLLASTALWYSGEAHRGIGPGARNNSEKRHDA